MKCSVCNYRYNEPEGDENGDRLISDGEEPFIKLINTFHRKDATAALMKLTFSPAPGARLSEWRSGRLEK